MPEPLTPEHFAFLAERAGLDPAKIGAERFEELRQGTRFLRALPAAACAAAGTAGRATAPPSRRISLSTRSLEAQRWTRRNSRLAEAEPRDRRRQPVAGRADRGLSRPHRRARRRTALLCPGLARRGAGRRARRPSARSSAGRSRGPLHGIPIGLKDIYKTKGIRTTAGSRVYLDHVPDEDAETWVRLRDAGTILLGKQETHEFAIGGPDFTLPFPPARNPWNTGALPGRLVERHGGGGRRASVRRRRWGRTPAARSAARPPIAACSG